jgi:hypothetical protein
MIQKIEFDGKYYPIRTGEVIENGVPKKYFYAAINDVEYKMTSQVDQDITDALKLIYGFDAEEELKNILTYEMKCDLFHILHNETVKEQFEKVFGLVGKTNEDLQALAASDEIFAIFLRNFHERI